MIAACFALGGFAAAVIVGAVTGNPAETVLVRALIVMAACWLIGHVVSYLASRAVAEHLQTYRQAHPIPEETDETDAAGAEASGDDASGDDTGASGEPGADTASPTGATGRSSSPGAGAEAQAVSPT